MQPTVTQLFTYPIKGLTPQKLDQTFLTIGHGIKGDRALALLFLDTIDQADQTLPWLSKKHFAVQNDWPELAALECQYQSGILTIKQHSKEVLVADYNTDLGKEQINQFFTEYIANSTPTEAARHPQKSAIKMVGDVRGNTRYPDREPVHISLISQATLDDLSKIAKKSIDSQRFRPNLIIDGIEAWEEFNWMGKQLQIGEAIIEIKAKIGRCVNIEVDPHTGHRDLPLLSLLKEHFGHAQTGVLATIIKDGNVHLGDQII